MKDAPTKNEVISLEVRQNRPDCLSVLGLAREISAVNKIAINTPELGNILNVKNDQGLVSIKRPALIKRFTAVKIDNLKVSSSPEWMQKLLSLYGIPSINNIVDITNFVMVEIGQPMHPFDFDNIKGGSLVVRNAKLGESLETFDGQHLSLNGSDLIISDDMGPVALAGIIGAKKSGVTNQTTTVLLEAAVYDNSNIRKTSRELNIRTEASLRLEKFLCPAQTETAIKRAIFLINEIIPDAKISGYCDHYITKTQPLTLDIDPKEVKRIGGITVTKNEISNALVSFGFLNDSFKKGFTVPYFRTDIEQKEDLIEEVLRYRGYSKIPSLPILNSPPDEKTSNKTLVSDRLKEFLTNLGFHEQITNPLVKKDGNTSRIILQNPLNKDKDSLRLSVTETLKAAANTYKKHRASSFRLFEIGNIYFKNNTGFKEEPSLACVFSNQFSFRQVKGYLEQIMIFLNLKEDQVVSLTASSFEMGLKEVSLKGINENYKVSWNFLHAYSEEISFLIDSPRAVGNILTEVKKRLDPSVEVALVDIYSGEGIPSTKKSVQLKVTVSSEENLNPSAAAKKIVAVRVALEKIGAEIRR